MAWSGKASRLAQPVRVPLKTRRHRETTDSAPPAVATMSISAPEWVTGSMSIMGMMVLSSSEETAATTSMVLRATAPATARGRPMTAVRTWARVLPVTRR